MSKNSNTERMVLRLFRVADILAQAESNNLKDTKVVDAESGSSGQVKPHKSSFKHTKN